MLRNILGRQMRGRERKIISWWSDDEIVGGRCRSWHDKISTVTSFFNLSWILSRQLTTCVKTTVGAGLSWSAVVKIILVFCAGCLYPCLINITTGWHLLSIYCGKNGFKMGADFNLSALNLYVPIFWYLHFVASWSDRNGYWDIKELVLPSWNKSQQIIVVFLYAFVSAYFNLKLEKAYSLGN